MNMRLVSVIGALWLLAGSLAAFNSDETDDYSGPRMVHVVLHDSSDVDWARLSVDGDDRGVVRKGQPLVLHLQGGASYLFRVQRAWNGRTYVRERLLRVEPGAGTQWVVLTPERQESDRSQARGYVNIMLPPGARVAWANLLINQTAYGMLRRGETRRFWLKAGMAHTVKLERVWNGKTYVAEQEVTVGDGQTRLLALSPAAAE